MTYYVDVSDERNIECGKHLTKAGFEVVEFSTNELKAESNNTCFIFAPSKRLSASECLLLPKGAVVFGGKLLDENRSLLANNEIIYNSFLDDENLVRKNAALTAEGLIVEIMKATNRSVYQSKYLILGFGRVGRETAKLFAKLDLTMAVATFDKTEFGTCNLERYYGYDFLPHINEFDVIINTIPALLFDEKMCHEFNNDLVILEVASSNCIKTIASPNFKYIQVPALPSRFTHKSAADLMFDVIMTNIT